MAKVSSTTADEVKDFGAAVDRCSTVDGYTIEFVSIREAMDLGPMLAGLPGGHCSCPHWGYLLQGRMTVRYADKTEVLEPGDAFYMTPGHVPAAEAGSEFVMFSPADELKATDAAIEAAMSAR
jgi:hypothetical protein